MKHRVIQRQIHNKQMNTDDRAMAPMMLDAMTVKNNSFFLFQLHLKKIEKKNILMDLAL